MAADTFDTALDATREIQLTVTGRKSGREISNPVWFIREGNKLYLAPVRGTDADWYKNVLKNPRIRLSAQGKELTAGAKPVTDSAVVTDVFDRLRAKYGGQAVASYYPKQNAAVEVPLSGSR